MAIGLAIFGFANAASGDDSKASAASEKAQKIFNKQFKDVSNVAWYDIQGGFKAEFTKDGHQTSSVYGKRGNWVYTIEYYKADNLDKNLIDLVKTEYDKYYISAIEKVESPAVDVVYVVHLENQDSFKTLRIHKTDIELVQDFKKG
jgi:hypothetical protein